MSPRSHGLSPRVPFVPEPLSRSFDRRVLRIAPLVPPAHDPLYGQGANDDGLPLGPASAVELLALAYGRRVDRSACLICIILQRCRVLQQPTRALSGGRVSTRLSGALRALGSRGSSRDVGDT